MPPHVTVFSQCQFARHISFCVLTRNENLNFWFARYDTFFFKIKSLYLERSGRYNPEDFFLNTFDAHLRRAKTLYTQLFESQ